MVANNLLSLSPQTPAPQKPLYDEASSGESDGTLANLIHLLSQLPSGLLSMLGIGGGQSGGSGFQGSGSSFGGSSARSGGNNALFSNDAIGAGLGRIPQRMAADGLPASPFAGMSDLDFRRSGAAPADVQIAQMQRDGFTHDQIVDYISRGAGYDWTPTASGHMTYGLSDAARNQLLQNMPPDAFLQKTIPGTNMSWDAIADRPVGQMHAAWGKDSMDALRLGPPAWPMSSNYAQEMLLAERKQMGPLAPLYDAFWGVMKPQTSYYDYGYPGSPMVFPPGVAPYDVASSLTPENQAIGRNMPESEINNLLASPDVSGNGVSFGR